MQPKRYQELSVTMKILVVSLCMGLPFFFSKANGSGESSQLSRGYSSLGVTALSGLQLSLPYVFRQNDLRGSK